MWETRKEVNKNHHKPSKTQKNPHAKIPINWGKALPQFLILNLKRAWLTVKPSGTGTTRAQRSARLSRMRKSRAGPCVAVWSCDSPVDPMTPKHAQPGNSAFGIGKKNTQKTHAQTRAVGCSQLFGYKGKANLSLEPKFPSNEDLQFDAFHSVLKMECAHIF